MLRWALSDAKRTRKWPSSGSSSAWSPTTSAAMSPRSSPRSTRGRDH